MSFKFKPMFKKRIRLVAGLLALSLILAGWLFYKSDIYYLTVPPSLRGTEKAAPRKKELLGITTAKVDEHLEEVCSKYQEITFFQSEMLAFYDDNGNKIQDITSINIPENLKKLTGLDKKSTYTERAKAADALGKNLAPHEIDALIYFMHKRVDRDYLDPLELNSVKNQVVLALMRQNSFPQELPLHLVAMYHDKNMDYVWRDYCIQFLGQTYRKLNKKEDRLLAKYTIIDSLRHNEDIAGSGIIALRGLANCSEVSNKEIADEAYKLASNEQVSHTVRIPALQIAAKFNHPEAIDLARELLKRKSAVTRSKTRDQELGNRNSPVPVMLQMSAIASIGMKGNRQDIALLEKYKNNSDIRLRAAAKAALKKL